MMDQELILLVAGALFMAVVAGVLAYFTRRNVEDGIVAAVESLIDNIEFIDAVEEEYEDYVPTEVDAVIDALLGVGARMAEGTATEADNKLLELLKLITDGEPNVAE